MVFSPETTRFSTPFSGTIELLHPSTTVLPCSLYRVPVRTPRINISAPRTILQVSFSNTVFTPASSNLLTEIRFLANAGICRTPGSVLTLPPCNFNFTFPRPMILAFLSSPKKTSPPSYFSYSQNHSLWGVK